MPSRLTWPPRPTSAPRSRAPSPASWAATVWRSCPPPRAASPAAQGALPQFSPPPTSDYLFDSAGQAIPVDRASAGFIALGTACPAELPTPTPSPAEDGGAGQTPEPGTTPGADATPAADGERGT